MTKLLAVGGLFVLAAGAGRAQETPPAPEREAPPPAAVRAWIFPGEAKDKLTLTVRRATAPEPATLATAENGARAAFLSYDAQPAGGAVFELRGEGDRVLASATSVLRPMTHYTLLAARTGGGWELQPFVDGAPPNASDRPVRVLNFSGGRETLLEFAAGKAEKVPGNALVELRLPAKINGFNVKVLAPDGGPPAQTSAEVDLDEYPAAYVVVAPDRRERLIPEIIEGGPAKTQPPPPPTVAVEFDPAEERRKERESRLNARRMERDHLAAEMAILKAQMEEGVNVPENAAELQREMGDRLKELRTETAEGGAPATPAPPAPQ
jgi:hypothetical protein